MAKARMISRTLEAVGRVLRPSSLDRLGMRGSGRGEPAAATTPVREAFGVYVDPDEENWRRLTADTTRDLSPMTLHRMRETALYLWQTSLLANRIVELPIAYLLAEGVALEAQDPDAQAWLNAFWDDPINRMERKLEKKVRELALYGEQCWPVFVNEVDGHVRLGYLDPELIGTVVCDPDNAEQPIGIVTVRDKKGQTKRFRIIVLGPESVFTQRTQQIRQTFTDGDCFYFAINNLSNGARGRSDLLAQTDWLDGYEQFLFGELERSDLLRSFLWDVTIKGATPEEVEQRAKKITTPKPASVRVHNDSEEWQAVTPDLQTGNQADSAKLFRNHMLGGATIPEFWYGGAADVNRNTASEMGDPTFKILSMRQRLWKSILEEIGAFVVWRRLDPSGASDPAAALADPSLKPIAQFPGLTTRDVSKYAAAMQQVVAAAVQAVSQSLISELLAVRLIALVASQLGLEFDAEEEFKAAQADKAKRAEADLFSTLPGDPAAADQGGGGGGA